MKGAMFALLLGAPVMPALAQETVFVIRHAEREDAGQDPDLTAAGRDRAAGWAALLREAGVQVVLTSDARRSRATGEIVAGALGVPRAEAPMMDVAGLIDLLTFDHEGKTALIVGHTETIPSILSHLGVTAKVTVDRTDHASLFVVAGSLGADPVLVHLRMP